MSRPGITYQEVAKAAIQLQGQNENPTVDRVREILNTGSKSTIARYLKEWKSKTGHVTGTDGIPHELIAIIKGLWERLKIESDKQTTQYQQDADRLVAEIKQSLAHEQKNNHDLQHKIHYLEDQLHQEKHHLQCSQLSLEEEKRSNAKLTERNERLTQQISDQKTEIERLHQLLTHVQNNLEHYQASIQKLRDEQQLDIEKKKATFEYEISMFKKNIDTITLEKNHIQSEYDKNAAQLGLLVQNNEKLQKHYQESIVNESILQQKCNQLEQTNLNYHNKIEEQSKLIIELDKRTTAFSTEISILQKSLQNAQDKIQLLQNDKLFIAQEKATLEGQLKFIETRSAI